MGQSTHHVIIVGGGFGGLAAANVLVHRPSVRVTLIDKRNHHVFQPLLYQVATAGLNPADIAVPIRSRFAKAVNVSVHLGRITAADLRSKTVTTADGTVTAFDFLILACGAQHCYFGNAQWEEFAPGLKTLEQAIEIRRRILCAFESAENSGAAEVQKALLTFVIVGGGATGVELAGAIADIARTVLVRDFRNINPASARVILVEGGPRILPTFSESLSEQASRDLGGLGVEVRCGSVVEHIAADGVIIGGERLPARSVFWAAGVQAAALTRSLDVPVDAAGRIAVEADLSIPGFPYVFAIGDNARVATQSGKLVPGVAPAALQMGAASARNVLAAIAGVRRTPFRYIDKGQMATIGKKKAVAEIGPLKLSGYVAWVAWLFVHILYLVSFRNRALVLAEWTWSYMFSKRGARLITEHDWRGA